MPTTKPTLLSLYSGCGGMDYGFEAAGFDTRAVLEFDPDCCETLRRNRPWPVLEKDIFEVPTSLLLNTAGLDRGQAALLIGGPPCQPFSKAGYWARGDSRRLEDPRAGTLSAYMRVVEEALPQAFVLENVSGLAFSGKDEGLQLLLGMISAINECARTNYQPHYKIVRAAEHGVPQLRERFILVAHREGLPFRFPEPTYALPGDENIFLEPARTAWDALGDLPEPANLAELAMKGKWAELLPTIPEGQNYLYHTERGEGLPLFGWRRRYWTFLLKLAKSLPSWTLQAQPGPAVGPFHWKNRRLSSLELCRLQTFPDDVILAGNLAAAQRQAGNAVPSLLAEVIGRGILEQWHGYKFASPPTLLPPKRPDMPPPEPLQKVKKHFLPLLNQETAHPGTGKGYRAALSQAE
jgi:DNA (cytosine-5)-methyltransferase 1